MNSDHSAAQRSPVASSFSHHLCLPKPIVAAAHAIKTIEKIKILTTFTTEGKGWYSSPSENAPYRSMSKVSMEPFLTGTCLMRQGSGSSHVGAPNTWMAFFTALKMPAETAW